MPHQTTFADLDYARKKRQTPREIFLGGMEAVVPWAALLARIEPCDPRSGRRGRQPMPLESMFRIYCMQNWFNLSDGRWKMPCMRLRACAALPASAVSPMRFRTRPRY